jgi:pimeloyl-ACP methyl ester carboxylesterase
MSRLNESRIIILVHGFNVDAENASKTYQDFLIRLQAQTWPAPLDSFGAFWGFHWPGDHRNRILSLLTFPVRVEVARSAGRELARLILDYLGPDQEVFLVAHSLGCRVVLEALVEIAARKGHPGQRKGASVQGTFLMAAAVPYLKCGEGAPFYQANRDHPRNWVIHSVHDWVLMMPFRAGEGEHGEGGSEAVGRHGWPLKRWSETVETDLGHGDYWETWNHVLENIPKMLRANGPRVLPERPDGSRSSRLPRSELPTRGSVPRQIGEPIRSDWQDLFERTSI